MSIHTLFREQRIARPKSEVFDFFKDPANLERITPSFLSFRIVTPLPFVVQQGALIDYRLGLFGIPFGWRTRIERFEPEIRFIDTQVRGPYKLWRHTHEFESTPEGTRMTDKVEYELPFGPLGTVARALFVRATLDRIFDYRATTIHAIFKR